jgi:hypothetical protein
MNKLFVKPVGAEQITGIEAYQMNIIEQLTFDKALCQYINENYPGITISQEDSFEVNIIPKRLQCVFSIIDKHCRCLRSPTKRSRLHSPVTRMKRELRKYLMLDGKHFQILDVKNAQIFLGYIAISDYIQKTTEGYIMEEEYPEDIRLLKQLSTEGKFYEYLAGKLGWDISTKAERNRFKDVFFTYAWYADLKPYNYNHVVARAFNENFPNVSAIIKELKKNYASDFPVHLQNMEAEIMLDVIGKTLMDNNVKFLTIHDAIMIKSDEDYTAIMEVMHSAFRAKYGAVPPISVESY